MQRNLQTRIWPLKLIEQTHLSKSRGKS